MMYIVDPEVIVEIAWLLIKMGSKLLLQAAPSTIYITQLYLQDLLLALDNQYLGIRKAFAKLVLEYQLVSRKVCLYANGWPKSFMVLNCVMLELDVVRNLGLNCRSDHWIDY